jgi:hypothetical protein
MASDRHCMTLRAQESNRYVHIKLYFSHRPERHPAFWTSPLDIQEMAAQQSVAPVENIDELRDEFWPEWESVEDRKRA